MHLGTNIYIVYDIFCKVSTLFTQNTPFLPFFSFIRRKNSIFAQISEKLIG